MLSSATRRVEVAQPSKQQQQHTLAIFDEQAVTTVLDARLNAAEDVARCFGHFQMCQCVRVCTCVRKKDRLRNFTCTITVNNDNILKYERRVPAAYVLRLKKRDTVETLVFFIRLDRLIVLISREQYFSIPDLVEFAAAQRMQLRWDAVASFVGGSGSTSMDFNVKW